VTAYVISTRSQREKNFLTSEIAMNYLAVVNTLDAGIKEDIYYLSTIPRVFFDPVVSVNQM